MKNWQIFFLIITLTFTGFFLRIYKVGDFDFKEDENITVSSAAYLHYCRQNFNNCRINHENYQNNVLKKILALILNKESQANLLVEIHRWSWIKKEALESIYNRAWPHTLILALNYNVFDISEFSSRLPSVIFGTLLIPLGFIFSLYFSGSKKIALIFSYLITFSFYFIDFSRQARMYALFIPFYLLVVYFLFKTFNEKSKRIRNIIFFGIFITFSYWLHFLVEFLGVAFLAFSVYCGFLKKQKNYQIVSLVIIFTLLILTITNKLTQLNLFHSHFFSIISKPSFFYFNFLSGSPLPPIISLSTIVLCLPFILSHKKYSYLLFIVVSQLIILTFFAKKGPASAYVLNILPLAMLLSLISLFYLLKKLKIKLVTHLFILFLFIFPLFHYLSYFNYLYLAKDGRARPAKAYQVIVNNFNSQQAVLGVQIRDYYLQKLPASAPVIDLGNNKILTQEEFLKILNSHPKSWIVWEIEKESHLREEIVRYIKTHSKKFAGAGIDDNQIEIFYYSKTL